MNRNARRLLIGFSGLALLLLLLSAPSWSAYCRHKFNKLRLKAEKRLASWRGQEPRLVQVTGNLAARGARVEILYSQTGWAALSDKQGGFTLPDVLWYPGASYDFIIATDVYNVRRLRLSAPEGLPENGILDVGELRLDGGEAVDHDRLLGSNSTSYLEHDRTNYLYYKDLYDKLTAGLGTDEQKLDAINRYVATRLNYKENAWEYESPRAILERGSRYCGHLSTAMAAIVGAGGYTVRHLDMTNGANPPNTHVVIEVYYHEGWHLYDPTYGVTFRNRRGQVANYKELRLDLGLVTPDAFKHLKSKVVRGVFAWLPDAYGSGYHHTYFYVGRNAACDSDWRPNMVRQSRSPGSFPNPLLALTRQS